MKRDYSLGLVFVLALTVVGSPARAHSPELRYAPPVFTSNGLTVTPIDIQQIELDLKFDVSNETARGRAVIRFNQNTPGNAMLDLIATPTGVWLDGQALGGSGLPTVKAPSDVTTLRAVSQASNEGPHTLEIEYDVPKNEITFTDGGVRIGFFMDDVSSDRGFLEQYAPSNLEFDAFEMDATVTVTGATNPHRLFSNGRLAKFGPDQWKINFPAHFTTSSFYLHLTDQTLAVEEAIFEGKEQQIPITVYSTSSSLTKSGMTNSKKIMAELEATFGPYAHSSLTVYLTSGGGGMEHCGATMTSLSALGHEITHSWFARGVMPANGNAGWIDEAMASWRDDGYPEGSTPSGSPTNLAGFPEFKRTTPYAAYGYGMELISDFDFMFKAQGGMKKIMSTFFMENRRTTVTTPQFADFLEAQTGQDLSEIFDRYVYNKTVSLPQFWQDGTLFQKQPRRHSKHPRPYTPEERALYR